MDRNAVLVVKLLNKLHLLLQGHVQDPGPGQRPREHQPDQADTGYLVRIMVKTVVIIKQTLDI